MTSRALKSVCAIVRALRTRMASSSQRASGLPLKGASEAHAASTGAVPPAAPVETSLQTLSRMVRLTHLPDGSPVQSMQLKCGGYVMARLLGVPKIGSIAIIRDGTLRIGRCFVEFNPDFQPDQWLLAIYPVNGKADLYEGFVE